MEEEREDIFILTDEDGIEKEFEHIDTISYKDNIYVALAPFDESIDEKLDENEDLEQEIYIMKVVKDDNDEEALVMVEDDAELDEVFAEFKNNLDELEEE